MLGLLDEGRARALRRETSEPMKMFEVFGYPPARARLPWEGKNVRCSIESTRASGRGRLRGAALAAVALALGLGTASACSTEDKRLQSQAKRAEAAGEYAVALKLMDRAIALAPEAGSYHRRRGSLLEELGREDEALKAYDRAIAAGVPSRSAHLRAIGLCLELDRLDEMEERLAAARAVLDDRTEIQTLAALEAKLRPSVSAGGPPETTARGVTGAD
jgi:tetratricopeptide (TPR) repeat protein